MLITSVSPSLAHSSKKSSSTHPRLSKKLPRLPHVTFGNAQWQPQWKDWIAKCGDFFVGKYYQLKEAHHPTEKHPETGNKYQQMAAGFPPPRPFQPFLDAQAKYAIDPKNYAYNKYQGEPYYRQALAEHLHDRFNITINADTQIIPTKASNEALFDLLKDMDVPTINGQPAQTWLPSPGYDTYNIASKAGGWGINTYSLSNENPYPYKGNPFLFDFNKAWGDMDKNAQARIKLLVLNYPNNPTGATAPKEYLNDVLRFANEHGLLVIRDFAYADTYQVDADGTPLTARPASMFELDAAKDPKAKLVEMHTFSKSMLIPSERAGYAVFSKALTEKHPDEPFAFSQGLLEIKKRRDATGPSYVFQKSLVDALKDKEGYRAFLQKENRLATEKYHAVRGILEKSGWDILGDANSVCPYYVWAKVPVKNMSSEDFAIKAFKEASVGVIPGAHLTPDGSTAGEGYIRIALSSNPLNKNPNNGEYTGPLIEAANRLAKLKGS